MGSAAAQSASAGIPTSTMRIHGRTREKIHNLQNPKRRGTRRRSQSDVLLPAANIVDVLGISLRASLVLVVIDKHVPSQLRVLGDGSLVARDRDVVVSSLVVTSLDEQGSMACSSQATGQRSSAGA